MKPAAFEYRCPQTLTEALEALNYFGSEAKLLAGGQSLVPAMNFRVVQPGCLIDLNRLSKMDSVQVEGSTLRIGAMTRERTLEFDPLIKKHLPLLAEAMPHVAHPQIRNRGTLGGSLAHADPAAELPVIMLALDARLKARTTSGERWIKAGDFFTGMFTTALQADEILVEIELPFATPRTGWSFMEVAPRHGDYALMGVACLITLSEDGVCHSARLVYLNAGEGPLDARLAAEMLVGHQPADSDILPAAEFASQKEIQPFGNLHASADFQRHLAKVLTMRAIHQAVRRAGENH